MSHLCGQVLRKMVLFFSFLFFHFGQKSIFVVVHGRSMDEGKPRQLTKFLVKMNPFEKVDAMTPL